ncbi:LacI family transcriptional regulator [Marinitenerispora sediminis]|uniref:LacI family transcriptional regulator n=2 Tax=Marinitenerispora sediminis TaxID=1931232 RepID=A0A368T5P6_9ACTN|nr:LacI family transcriptional regulator [Marinitenerispora sediminis]RCV52748.1 LacI family transcriptional regulator [Marinitenerispora sediminis]RCV59007.1 LacI family transcriptional regulator [Marinitenerispora sediminis]
MADVARLAGVSHQTVSRVLNGHPNVRDATRERVRAAIEELGYRRNSSARALVTRRTNVLGVIAVDTTLYGPASTLFGLEQAARAAGYFVSIVSLKSGDTVSLAPAIGYLAEQSIEGLVLITPKRVTAESLAALPETLPVVAVEGGQAPDIPVVCVDQFTGAVTATRHLLDLGHRTVWHVSGPAGWLEAEGRIQGWRSALRAAGAAAPDPVPGDWTPRSGYAAGLRLARDPEVTAVFVANDQMALGVLRAFSEAGVRVPDDVSVVGFDDIPEAEFFTPPLTTVWQDFTQVGERSIEVLLEQIDGAAGRGGDPARVVVPTRLAVRASTARAARSRRDQGGTRQ